MVVEAEVIYKLASSGVDSTWLYLHLMSDLKRMVVITLISAQSSFFNYSHLAMISPSTRLGTRGRLSFAGCWLRYGRAQLSARHGIEVAERLPHVFASNQHNQGYLRTKALKSGHLFGSADIT